MRDEMAGKKNQKPSDIERIFARLYEPDVSPSSPRYWPMVRDAMRDTAFHEAGHVVARVFTQLEVNHILHVSIIPDEHTLGHARVERPITERILSMLPGYLTRCDGRRLLIELFAGDGATMRVNGNSESYWSILEEMQERDEDEIEESDCFRILRIARIMSHPHMPEHRILRLAESWTKEMLDIPEVWTAIERFAKALIGRGTIDDRGEIHALTKGVPNVFNLPKWRRRLFPSKKEREEVFGPLPRLGRFRG
jgi:hypothetical protein